MDKTIYDISVIVVGVIVADLGMWQIRKYFKKRHMRRLNQLSQLKRKKKSQQIETIIGSTYVKDGNHTIVGERRPLHPKANLNPAGAKNEV